MGAGASTTIRDPNDHSDQARVISGVLQTSGAGGGNVTIIAPLPVPIDIAAQSFSPVVVKIMADKIPFSSSVNGRPIQVGAVATPGTLIHTTIANNRDRITMYASNTGAVDVTLTIEFGGVTGPDLINVFCPALETVVVLDEVPLQEGLLIRAFASIASTINLAGYFEREAV